jgi:Flp pilus assembly protein TadG
MSSRYGHPKRRSRERGSVIIMTAISMLFLMLLVGFTIDVSRIYMVRAEIQNAADAAALTAARELNGGTGGIDEAVAQANAIVNTRGFGKAGVGVAAIEFAVTFVQDSYGNDLTTYMSATDAKAVSTVKNVRYVRVTTQAATTNILFAVKALGTSHTESAMAVAGMSVEIDGICDFFPAAVALADPSPTPGTLMTLTFNQGTGNEAVIGDKQYIVLEVDENELQGNGEVETAKLAAGLPTFCKKMGDVIHMTPSSNIGNGGKAAGDGMNTRFNDYANGYGNALKATLIDGTKRFKPDTNIKEDISHYDYINKTQGQVTTPNPNGPGKDERRLIVAPIILPNGPSPLQPTYPAYTTNIKAWGTFFVRRKMYAPNGNCENQPPCGSLFVEYVGVAQLGNGTFTCGTGLVTPVLYR